jgi:hydrogenase expression/formation protein HypC
MCLSIPAEIINIENNIAIVSIGGSLVQVDTSLIDDPAVGDFILVHTGMALSKISAEEAAATLEIFREYAEFNSRLDEEENQAEKGEE